MGLFSNEIRAYALKNAIEFGKADVSKVLPKLFQHGLEKPDVGKIMPEVKKTIAEVNKLSNTQRIKEFEKVKGFVKVREEKKRELPELEGRKSKMILRVAPFPSGALHLGHAKTFLLNAFYAEKSKGKVILVMDDTIGSAKKPLVKEAYDLIENGLKYLGIKHGKIIYKSDRLKIYYGYAEKLIKKEKAYVCHCDIEEMRENRKHGRACSCRLLPTKVQLDRWKKMFKAKEGKSVLRLKTGMLNPNPAFRDRVLFKISDRKHVRVGSKYRVWPTLEMSWAIDDHLLKISHIIRGNDLVIESDMEKFIWKIFSWSAPEITHTGFVTIEGAKISKSKSRQEVESGKFSGWDDPRTWSLQSLERRGITKEAIREFFMDIGLNRQDITVPIENLYAINRRILDSSAARHSFVEKPKELGILGGPGWKEIEVPIHPDRKEKRKVKLGKIYISGEDFSRLEGKEVRLLHLFNVRVGKSSKVTSIENKSIQKINWVSDSVPGRVLLPTGIWVSGKCDAGVSALKQGEIIQFERFGFCKYQGKKKVSGKEVYEFSFAHK